MHACMQHPEIAISGSYTATTGIVFTEPPASMYPLCSPSGGVCVSDDRTLASELSAHS